MRRAWISVAGHAGQTTDRETDGRTDGHKTIERVVVGCIASCDAIDLLPCNLLMDCLAGGPMQATIATMLLCLPQGWASDVIRLRRLTPAMC